MATPKPINTRILLRNDTLEHWTGSSLVLGKGEVAIATLAGGKLAEVRVGNNTTWANSLKLNVNADQISGLVETIQGTTKKYQVVANGTNSWKLQEAPLSAADNEWTDVAGSTTWTVDFSGLSYNGGEFGTTKFVTKVTEANGVVAAEYAQPAISDINGLQTALDAKLAKTEFANLSVEIGLDAASASNKVVTKKDIADLTGAMHFKGAVESLDGINSAKPGDVVIITSTSKEYVYNGSAEAPYSVGNWVELGDEVLYATKAEVVTISAGLTSDIAKLTANDEYLSGQIASITSNYATKTELTNAANALSTDYNSKINALSDTYATKTLASQMSAYALEQANDYTNSKVAGLSDYYTKVEVDAISSALSTTAHSEITAVVGQAGDASSANTIYGAKKYADETSAYALEQATGYADALSTALSNTVSTDYIRHHEVVDTDLSGFFILDCGASALRTDEPPFNA